MNLRVAYSLPANLSSYVGPVGVWGDVNDILQENLICMRVRSHILLLCFHAMPCFSWLTEQSAFCCSQTDAESHFVLDSIPEAPTGRTAFQVQVSCGLHDVSDRLQVCKGNHKISSQARMAP